MRTFSSIAQIIVFSSTSKYMEIATNPTRRNVLVNREFSWTNDCCCSSDRYQIIELTSLYWLQGYLEQIYGPHLALTPLFFFPYSCFYFFSWFPHLWCFYFHLNVLYISLCLASNLFLELSHVYTNRKTFPVSTLAKYFLRKHIETLSLQVS